MNIDKAINKIIWRVEGHGWKANQNDIDAIKKIIEYVKIKEEEQFKKHELFSKLYVHLYSEFRKKYENPIKELHRLLNYPLSVHIQIFTSKLNDNEVENLFNELNFLKKHPATIPKEIKDKETDILQQAVKHQENEDKLFRKVWKPEIVSKILMDQINIFLNKYYHDKRA